MKTFNLEALKERKKALREKQRNLSYEEKIEMFERLHEHARFIKANPIKVIKK